MAAPLEQAQSVGDTDPGRLRGLEPLTAPFRRPSLLRLLLARDVQAAFRGSALGLAWVVLIPLSFVAIYSFVFGVVVKTSWGGGARAPFETPLIYFMCLMMLGFFMEAITRAASQIRDNAVYVTKIVFPLDLLGWVIVGAALVKVGINFVLLAGALALATGAPPWKLLLLPALLAPLALLTLGVVWAFSAVGAYVRDLSPALQAAAPVLTFLTPIFYAVEQVPPAFRGLFYLNPLTFPIETARGAIFIGRPFPWDGYLLYCLAAGTVCLGGAWVFQRLRPGFADVV